VAREHPRWQDRHAAAPTHRAIQVGTAEGGCARRASPRRGARPRRRRPRSPLRRSCATRPVAVMATRRRGGTDRRSDAAGRAPWSNPRARDTAWSQPRPRTDRGCAGRASGLPARAVLPSGRSRATLCGTPSHARLEHASRYAGSARADARACLHRDAAARDRRARAARRLVLRSGTTSPDAPRADPSTARRRAAPSAAARDVPPCRPPRRLPTRPPRPGRRATSSMGSCPAARARRRRRRLRRWAARPPPRTPRHTRDRRGGRRRAGGSRRSNGTTGIRRACPTIPICGRPADAPASVGERRDAAPATGGEPRHDPGGA